MNIVVVSLNITTTVSKKRKVPDDESVYTQFSQHFLKTCVLLIDQCVCKV